VRVILFGCAGAAVVAAGVWIAVGVLFPRTWGCPAVVTYRVGVLDAAWTQVIAVMVVAVAAIVACAAGAALAARRDRTGVMTALGFLAVGGVLALLPTFVMAATFTRTWVYTQVEGDTGGRDLLVREWSFLMAGGGEILERDGAMLTRIGTTASDDGHAPFAAGAYTVTRDRDAVSLYWAFHADEAARDAVVTLPLQGEPADGASGCASWNPGSATFSDGG
jgi:hypothetical protein